MCQIFAGRDPKSYAPVTRSVRLGGYSTSIRLEVTFWEILDEIAAQQDMTTPRFLSVLYDEVLELHGEVSNFASLLRVSCTRFMESRDETLKSAQAELAAPAGKPAARDLSNVVAAGA
jgi:predicted DNA-binding ribbon-helix-helix protein